MGTVVELLQQHADERPADRAFVFLDEDHESAVTYAELDSAARRVATAVSASGAAGEPVLLLAADCGAKLALGVSGLVDAARTLAAAALPHRGHRRRAGRPPVARLDLHRRHSPPIHRRAAGRRRDRCDPRTRQSASVT